MADDRRSIIVYFRDSATLQYEISESELGRLTNDFVQSKGNGTGAYEVYDGSEKRVLVLRFDQVRNLG